MSYLIRLEWRKLTRQMMATRAMPVLIRAITMWRWLKRRQNLKRRKRSSSVKAAAAVWGKSLKELHGGRRHP